MKNLLNLLRINPHATNLQLADTLEVSVSKIKNCLRALREGGAIVCETRRFKLQGWSNQRTVEIRED